MSNTEKIAIILATYNPNTEFFAKQIQSLKNQSWSNWICHIVDDCSQLDYQLFIKKIVADDARFICHFHRQNLNTYYNFERGLQYCLDDSTTTAICFCDQDDIWQPEKLKISLENLRNEKAVLVHSDLELINTHDQIIHPSTWDFEGRKPEKISVELLLLRNIITGCSLLFCTSLLPNILPFPRQDEVAWHHDWWVALVAAQVGKIVYIRQSLVRYRIHTSNTVGVRKDAGKIYRELFVLFRKKFKITANSYLIHYNLSQAFTTRFQKEINANWLNPFDDKKLDFGFRILRFYYQISLINHNSEGIVLRIWFCKVLFDIQKLRRQLSNTFDKSHL